MRFLILGGVGATILLTLLSQMVFDRFIRNLGDETRLVNTPTFESDSFTQALAIASSANIAGKTAETSIEWFAIAQQWQQASDLMQMVSAADSRYESAQDRANFYRSNMEYARRKADSAPE